jgi:predicted nuclease of restriction endonuclease-like (RecB) superfamily
MPKERKSPALTGKGGIEYARMLEAIEAASSSMLGRAAAVVNQALVIRNWIVGAHLVEYEQGGSDRAQYGARLLRRLADDLAVRGVKGLGLTALKSCRRLFHAYPQIGRTLPDEFGQRLSSVRETGRTLADPSSDDALAITALPAGQLLRLSWSHLDELLSVEDPIKRAFYENECLAGAWSVRQLQRQIESLLYERTGLSSDKHAVINRARRRESVEAVTTVAELIRDPYVLEFTGLAEQPVWSEADLETALLDHLQRFLLELGTGFCFEARQFRMTVGNKHDRVDLVFYHRRLRCHVLVDLKVRAFRHSDAGQMNFYLNWFKAHMQGDGDNPPVGIILASGKNGTEVEFATAGMDNQLFVSRYVVALPSAEQLRELVEADRARFVQANRAADDMDDGREGDAS